MWLESQFRSASHTLEFRDETFLGLYNIKTNSKHLSAHIIQCIVCAGSPDWGEQRLWYVAWLLPPMAAMAIISPIVPSTQHLRLPLKRPCCVLDVFFLFRVYN